MAHNESVEDCKTIAGQSSESLSNSTEYNMQVTTFTEDLKDVTLHFQIIQLPRQRNEVTVASILGGAADNTGLSISRRLVIKTGLNIVLACNIPKNCPMIEADAERLLLQKLKSLGYIKPNSGSVAS
ncbi:uncharacterized protein LOC116253965 isoform X2 [Nymphaea colorata]|uniref:uncharacterized protein LOC116253965 isoform X2 n=1 Tax=Nymphaea colorata TaxID=210225 RepID=UPI00129ED61F|nr:uncharacterized protein LOC116253965 isoform X2 [Nymphaea colorata]